MSWASKMVDKARRTTDSLGDDLGLSESQKKYFRIGVSTMGGGIGMQYEYSRNKGMNSDEAFKNASTGGAQYSTSRGMQQARVAGDAADEAAVATTRRELAEARRARNAMAVRARRAGRSDRPTTHGGTLVTGALGLPGTSTPERGTRLGL